MRLKVLVDKKNELLEDILSSDPVRFVRRNIKRFTVLFFARVFRIIYGDSYIRVTCPLCGWRGNRFINYDNGYGVVFPHIECPRCHSHDRHRLFYFYIRDLLRGNVRALRVLHISPEKHVTKLLMNIPGIRYVSVDIESGKALIQADIERLPFDSGSFDIIICFCVLEHVKNDQNAMNELYRVLKPNGVCAIIVPINEYIRTTVKSEADMTRKDRTRIFWQADHARLYAPDFPNHLKKSRFIVSKYTARSVPGKSASEKYGLPKFPMYLCTKQSSPYLPRAYQI